MSTFVMAVTRWSSACMRTGVHSVATCDSQHHHASTPDCRMCNIIPWKRKIKLCQPCGNDVSRDSDENRCAPDPKVAQGLKKNPPKAGINAAQGCLQILLD